MTGEHKRVVVIGAGIAGLVAAKVLRDDGFDVTVYEKEPGIGGVWHASRTYPGLRTNNSRHTYAFSDHPYDRSADLFPTAEDVRRYLESYVRRFELAPLIRVSTEVVRVAQRDAGFEIAINGPDGPAELRCEFVVVATGTYSAPHIPEIPGAQQFTGTILHSSQATDPELTAGRRIVVVGAGKSALDCAAWAAERARSCTLVFRTPHWMLPRYAPGRIPMDRLILGRLPEMFIRYHRLDRVEQLLHGRGRILTWLFWRGAERLFRGLLRVPTIMIPAEPLPRGLENVGFTSEFYELAHSGRIGLRHSSIESFGPDGAALLTDGERLDADTVVFATGWRQSFDFLAPELRSAAMRDGRFQLYRHALPPTEPRLGFVGYASSTACQLTSEISAHWLSQTFRGDLTLPDTDTMTAEVQRVHAWLAETLPARPQGYYVGPHMIHYIDDLLSDMGLPTRRTRTTIGDYLKPFSPSRYRDITDQRRRARTTSR